jgi:replicative DNA helicase
LNHSQRNVINGEPGYLVFAALQQDADVIVFLYREAYYLERMACADQVEEEKRFARFLEIRHQLEANIAKQRNGPTGPVTLFFDVASNAVRDMARREP